MAHLPSMVENLPRQGNKTDKFLVAILPICGKSGSKSAHQHSYYYYYPDYYLR